ncbi:SPW repeat protein [Mycobacterium sp. 3519A]|uniref:SPW repeat domain-containing protein n=1 Tax=Mycobacterium sp. 3519A TaxID=2057184 RepID=UPI000C7B44B5|nr:SPW repeat protein [Mycobacterium sp. 3519A]
MTVVDRGKSWIGRAALAVGLVGVLRGVAMPVPTTGTAVLIGLGGLAAVVALWSLLAVDPTYDFVTLAIIGAALFVSPWVGGFVTHDLAMTAWVVGALITALGVIGYRRREHIGLTETGPSDAASRYDTRFRLARW